MMEVYSITGKLVSGVVAVVFKKVNPMEGFKRKFSTEGILDFSMSYVRRKLFERPNYIKLLQNWSQNMEVLRDTSTTHSICCSQDNMKKISGRMGESVHSNLETTDVFDVIQCSTNKLTAMDYMSKQINYASLDEAVPSCEKFESSKEVSQVCYMKKSERADVKAVQGPTSHLEMKDKSVIDSEKVISCVSKFLVKPSGSFSDEDWATSSDDGTEWSDDDGLWGEGSDDDDEVAYKEDCHTEAIAFEPKDMILSPRNHDFLSTEHDPLFYAEMKAGFKKDIPIVSKFFVRPSQSFSSEEDDMSSDDSTKCSDDDEDDDDGSVWAKERNDIVCVDEDSCYNEAFDSTSGILFPGNPNLLSADHNDNDSSGIGVDDYSDNSEDEIIFCDDDDDDDAASCKLGKTSQLNTHAKRVKFTEDVKFFEVDARWSAGELTDARCGPWEMYARDRERFKMRILAAEKNLTALFETEHRNQMRKIVQDSNIKMML